MKSVHDEAICSVCDIASTLGIENSTERKRCLSRFSCGSECETHPHVIMQAFTSLQHHLNSRRPSKTLSTHSVPSHNNHSISGLVRGCDTFHLTHGHCSSDTSLLQSQSHTTATTISHSCNTVRSYLSRQTFRLPSLHRKKLSSFSRQRGYIALELN